MKLFKMVLFLFVIQSSTYAVTIGDALINRSANDGAVGFIFILTGQTFGEEGVVTSWAFFDDDNFSPDRNVTPLLFEQFSPGQFRLTGIGASRLTDESGVQNHAFDLLGGTANVGAQHTFGFIDGVVDSSLNVTSTNAGVIDHENSVPGGDWQFVNGTHSSLSLDLTIGSGQSRDFGTASSPRVYSMQVTTNEAVIPEPSTFFLLGFLPVWTIFRKRY